MHLLDALKQSRSQRNAVKFRGLNVNISSIWHRNKNDVCMYHLQHQHIQPHWREPTESNERIMNRLAYSCEYDEQDDVAIGWQGSRANKFNGHQERKLQCDLMIARQHKAHSAQTHTPRAEQRGENVSPPPPLMPTTKSSLLLLWSPTPSLLLTDFTENTHNTNVTVH